MEDLVFLTQTDTTVGFVSQNAHRLTQIKQRPPHKHYIKAVDSLCTLSTLTRIPNQHKNRVRRARKSTFILPSGHSYRVVHDPLHLKLLSQLRWAYTTSANQSAKSYDEAWARRMADKVIEPLKGEVLPSEIYKINKQKIQKIR